MQWNDPRSCFKDSRRGAVPFGSPDAPKYYRGNPVCNQVAFWKKVNLREARYLYDIKMGRHKTQLNGEAPPPADYAVGDRFDAFDKTYETKYGDTANWEDPPIDLSRKGRAKQAEVTVKQLRSFRSEMAESMTRLRKQMGSRLRER
eukprot:TRINITY_DN18489_c0_g1_i2.p1 TRINITY_DN18489_c0_g1~~TRINITY_DN18489_c0_g1_i2.p1  ORF type:complete len:146 (-),score=32.54 TRINITY_DN18489_c0_g1_i2:198-635(-)